MKLEHMEVSNLVHMYQYCQMQLFAAVSLKKKEYRSDSHMFDPFYFVRVLGMSELECIHPNPIRYVWLQTIHGGSRGTWNFSVSPS